MSSEWWIMRDTHAVLARVEVEGPEFDHIRSVVVAGQRFAKLSLLARIESYWDDADFLPNEIGPLRTELLEVGRVPGLPTNVASLLEKLVGLCDVAIREGKAIEVRAD